MVNLTLSIIDKVDRICKVIETSIAILLKYQATFPLFRECGFVVVGSGALFLLQLGRASFNELRNLDDHFPVRLAASRFETAMQALRDIDTEPARGFLFFHFWGFPHSRFCGKVGLCVLPGSAPLKSGNAFRR
jgi:hypothetical protein